jgi:uroporphyrinogen-III synthase
MRVLVTRPEADARALAQLLHAGGHQPIVAPLLEIRASDDPLPEDCAEAVLLFTSANGVRMARQRGLAPSRPVYVVGPATAAAAQVAGFALGGIAAGDVRALAELVARDLPLSARLLHVSGDAPAGDLTGDLGARGFIAQRFTAYRAVAAAQLPAACAEFFRGPPGAVLLFSPHSAAILARLMTQAGLEARAAQHRALTLSAAVALEIDGLDWQRVEVAASPETGALLALL